MGDAPPHGPRVATLTDSNVNAGTANDEGRSAEENERLGLHGAVQSDMQAGDSPVCTTVTPVQETDTNARSELVICHRSDMHSARSPVWTTPVQETDTNARSELVICHRSDMHSARSPVWTTPVQETDTNARSELVICHRSDMHSDRSPVWTTPVQETATNIPSALVICHRSNMHADGSKFSSLDNSSARDEPSALVL